MNCIFFGEKIYEADVHTNIERHDGQKIHLHGNVHKIVEKVTSI